MFLPTPAISGLTLSFSCSMNGAIPASSREFLRDYFSAEGQLWGNPVYNWDALRATGYRWSIDRLRALLAHVDAIRLDHFRGFAAAWHVPAGAPTAQSGQWVQGPGSGFFQAVQKELGTLPFIAEDLGLITPDVHALRDQFQLPGTRVLQFAFDGHSDNPYLPQQLCQQHGRLHGHARQCSNPGMVRGIARIPAPEFLELSEPHAGSG